MIIVIDFLHIFTRKSMELWFSTMYLYPTSVENPKGKRKMDISENLVTAIRSGIIEPFRIHTTSKWR
ncbi:MAG: hypothetical protein AYK19_05155 [Theionarchaea archaeon DG-70-1]|nr:MAG: hypothetical protein AYK19_05155 [Theionarchaea archaeon DG-70-1]